MRSLIFSVLLALSLSSTSYAGFARVKADESKVTPKAEVKPKYGSEATPLSLSHGYFRTHSAVHFWQLIPYYVHQQDDRSCSVAAVAMIVNGARVGLKLAAEDELISQQTLVEKVGNRSWRRNIGMMGQGVTLDELGPILEASLKVYGIESVQIQTEHVDEIGEKSRKKLREALVQFEKNPRELLVVNFLQGVLTGDAEIGHIAPIAAYDAAQKRVLVLDPDRKWYEPYWVSETALLKAMATPDHQSGRNRGYLRIKLPERR